MKKFIIFMFALMIGFASVNAQTALQTTKFTDNIYVGVNAGVNTPLSFNQTFPINEVVGLRIGKDFTPVFGLNVEGTVGFNDHANGHTDGFINHFAGSTFVKDVTVGANGTINWSNLLFGYKGEPRLFEVNTITGLSWAHIYDAPTNDGDELLTKTGFDLAFNLGKTKAWQLYVEPAVVWNLSCGDEGNSFGTYLDGLEFNKNHAYLQLAIGLNYKFKTSNGTHNFKLWNIGDMNNRMSELNNEINNLRAELAKKPTKVVVNNYSDSHYFVFFAQNSNELTASAKDVLDSIPSGINVDVVATASPEGTPKYNQELSQKRADVVKEYLTNRGINVVSADGLGVTGDSSNRVAVITIK